MATPKQTKGRQKIVMERIENDDDRLITFSKRRSGIYKKASELVTLCGVEVGVLVFSPAGRPFTFGHPSLEAITNRFLGRNLPPNHNTHPLIEAHRKMRISELTQQYNEVISRLEAETERGKWLQRMMKGKERDSSWWWDVPIDQLNVEELQQIYAKFEELHTNLCRHIAENSINGGAPSNALMNGNLPPLGSMMMNNSFAVPNPNQNHFSYVPPSYGYGGMHF